MKLGLGHGVDGEFHSAGRMKVYRRLAKMSALNFLIRNIGDYKGNWAQHCIHELPFFNLSTKWGLLYASAYFICICGLNDCRSLLVRCHSLQNRSPNWIVGRDLMDIYWVYRMWRCVLLMQDMLSVRLQPAQLWFKCGLVIVGWKGNERKCCKFG